MSRCFVTGASGFIGSRSVSALLARGHRVMAGVGVKSTCAISRGTVLNLVDVDGSAQELG